jgi:hypothetical protein
MVANLSLKARSGARWIATGSGGDGAEEWQNQGKPVSIRL